jgi:hypothetical protein
MQDDLNESPNLHAYTLELVWKFTDWDFRKLFLNDFPHSER